MEIQAWDSKLAIPYHFSARSRWCLNLLSSGQTYSLPGALHHSGTKPAPPSEYIPLGRRSAFLASRVCWRARGTVARNGKSLDRNRSPLRPPAPGDYFSELFTDVNRLFSVVPRPLTVAMMARLMPAAINPYSIAVAADWSAKNLENIVFIFPPPGR